MQNLRLHASKSAILPCNKKFSLVESRITKRNVSQKTDQKICHAPKIAHICNFIADSKSLRAGLNMIIWLSCCNMPWQKKLRLFQQPTRASKISGNNRFGVPMHFKTKRFIIKKFPPPPPLLHPNIQLQSSKNKNGNEFFPGRDSFVYLISWT